MPSAADPGGSDAAARLGRAWRQLRRGPSTTVVIEHLLGKHGEPGSLEPGQLDVLDLLSTSDERRMSDLAAVLHVDPSTVTRMLQRMEASGLAQRSGTSGDGRVVTAHLTAEGRSRHADIAARRVALLDDVLAAFSPDEREHLLTLLDKLVESLTAYAADVGREREPDHG